MGTWRRAFPLLDGTWLPFTRAERTQGEPPRKVEVRTRTHQALWTKEAEMEKGRMPKRLRPRKFSRCSFLNAVR
jgi:hypothetical protein